MAKARSISEQRKLYGKMPTQVIYIRARNLFQILHLICDDLYAFFVFRPASPPPSFYIALWRGGGGGTKNKLSLIYFLFCYRISRRNEKLRINSYSSSGANSIEKRWHSPSFKLAADTKSTQRITQDNNTTQIQHVGNMSIDRTLLSIIFPFVARRTQKTVVHTLG